LAIAQAIFNRRASQAFMFSQPAEQAGGVGWDLSTKDGHRPSAEERYEIARLRDLLLAGGDGPSDPCAPIQRRDIGECMQSLVRDSLTYDAMAIEPVLHPGTQQLYEYHAIAGDTIRLAADTRPDARRRERPWHPEFDGQRYDYLSSDGLPTRYVQVIDGVIRTTYSDRQLIYIVRNPRNDLTIRGYGYSEIEQGITLVTGMLESEKYQVNLFKQGSLPPGVFHLKGAGWSEQQIEALKRQWYATLIGADSAHKVPVVQFDGEMAFIHMSRTNRDMEFTPWQEFLIAVFCALYLIDPEEMGLQVRGGQAQTPLFEASAEWKIKASRDGGLKPLLRALARAMQRLVDHYDDRYLFRFVGLDEPSEQERHRRLMEELSAFRSINEVRVMRGLEPQDHPAYNMPMNPTALSAMKLLAELSEKSRPGAIITGEE
jgi:hypothetical protein